MASAVAMQIPVFRRHSGLEPKRLVTMAWAEGEHPPEWSRDVCLSLSDPRCSHCDGLGMVRRERARGGFHCRPCDCAARRAFRVVMRRYHVMASRSGMVSKSAISEVGSGSLRSRVYGRPVEEFLADVELTARRALSGEDYQMFRWRHLWCLPVERIMARLRWTDRMVRYKADQVAIRVGKAFVESRPHPIWPLHRYFE